MTSAVAGEGKTSLVCNLAAAFGLEGDRVLLIDADLRRPSVGNYLGINPTSGLSTVLLGERQPHDAVESWRGGLFDVLTSGPIPENPSELLGSKRTSVMLTELESRYDVVLIDSPALLPVADGSVLARACDAALLVVRHGQTPASEITDALAELRAVSARVLGCAFSMEPQPSRTFRSRTDTLRFRKRTASGGGATSTWPGRPPRTARIPTSLLHSIRMPPSPNTTSRLWIRSELVRVPWLHSTKTATRRWSWFLDRRPRRR